MTRFFKEAGFLYSRLLSIQASILFENILIPLYNIKFVLTIANKISIRYSRR